MSTPSSALSARSPLVDRRAEVAAFRAAVTRVAGRMPAVIQLSGELGSGRTRLLEEFATIARSTDAGLLLTRDTHQRDDPFEPLRHASTSGPLVGLLQTLDRPHGGDADFAHVIAALTDAAATAPLWLLIDDLHQADEATRALVERLLAALFHGSLSRTGIGVVVTLQAGEQTQELTQRLAALDRSGASLVMSLAAFTPEEVRSWLVARFATAPHASLVQLLHEASGGNPLLLRELTTHLQRNGMLREADGYLSATGLQGRASLPGDLTGLLKSRIDSVSPACRRAMTLAACLGDAFQPRALAVLLPQSAPPLEELVEEALRAAIIERRDDGRLAFSHGAARDFLYHGPDQSEREASHLRIGQRLIGEFGDGADEHCLTITHHLIRAGSAADADLVVRFASRAGALALSHNSCFLAGRYYEAAATAAAGLLPPAEQAALYCNAGEAFQRWSDGARSDGCFARAIALYEQADDLAGYARALHGTLRNGIAFGEPGGRTAEVATQLEQLIRNLPNDAVELRVRVHDTLAAWYHVLTRYDVAEAYAQTAMSIARDSRDPALRCIPVTSLALAQLEQLRLTDARATWLEGLSYDRAAGAARYEGYHLQRLPIPLYCLGETQEAARYNKASYRHNRAIGNTGELCINLGIDAMIGNLRGDFDGAIACAREAVTLVTSTRYLWAAPAVMGALAYALTMRQRFDEAHEVIDHLSTPGLTFGDVGPYRSTASRLRELVRAHQHSGATAPLRYVQEPGRQRTRGVRVGSLARLCAEAELALLQNAPQRLAGIHDTLGYVHRRGIALPLGWCCTIPRALAAATALRGDHERAAVVFDQARALAERCDAELEVARADLYQGLAALALPGAQRPDPGTHLDRALEAFQRLDAPALAQLARQAVARAGGTTAGVSASTTTPE